jgi:hypothetical protein
MSSLHELDYRFLALLDQLDDPDIDPETLDVDSLFSDRREKQLGYAKLIENLGVESDALAAKIKSLQARKKAIEGKIEWLETRLIQSMELEGVVKIKDDSISVTLAKPLKKLQRGLPEALPPELVSIVLKPAHSNEITKWIEQGGQAEGWEIILGQPSLRIK